MAIVVSTNSIFDCMHVAVITIQCVRPKMDNKVVYYYGLCGSKTLAIVSPAQLVLLALRQLNNSSVVCQQLHSAVIASFCGRSKVFLCRADTVVMASAGWKMLLLLLLAGLLGRGKQCRIALYNSLLYAYSLDCSCMQHNQH